jgi:hypothetical protein
MSNQLFATVSVEQQEIVAGGSDSRIVKINETSKFKELLNIGTKTSANRHGAKTDTRFKQLVASAADLDSIFFV